MSSEIIRQYEKAMLRTDIPDFKPGDRLRVSLKIVEGDKERLQDFEGDLIRRKGSGITETITLRKVNYGVGVERIIPLHSPKVEKIKVVRQGRVRRAKLYYIRELSGKAARIKERKVLYGEAAKKAKAAEAARLAEQEEKRQQALAEQEQTKAQAEAQEQKAAEAASAQEQKAAEATSAEATTAEAPAAEAPEAKAEAAPEAATEETENKE